MRFIMKMAMPTETGNALIKSGKLGPTIQSILEEQKPEAVYFTAENGKRTAYVVVDIADPSQMPRLAEPWFLAFNASVEFLPAMKPEDLMKAGPDLENAAKKFA